MAETLEPILYSFRRCPYAMRARMTLRQAGIHWQHREVVLRNKPKALFAASSKGTVPVLQLANDEVLDESLAIMHWALKQHDPDDWLTAHTQASQQLVAENDSNFKHWLDRYKYADRFPEQSAIWYRQQAEQFLAECEQLLEQQAGKGLMAERISFADIAIFPFIRQFAHVDLAWFEASPYTALLHWLNALKASPLFTGVMHKQPAWQAPN